MYFQFNGTCKRCHKNMTFALSLDSEDFDHELIYEVRCSECGHRISGPDIERFIHIADTLTFTNEQNATANITQISIRQR